MATPRTRKSISDLTQKDIQDFPVWEFATDDEAIEGRDETWVRPLICQSIPSDAYSLSVRANFKAPTGQEFIGIVSVSTSAEFETVHAAILTHDDYIFIPWPSYPEARQSAAEAASQLSIAVNDLFPLHFELALPVEGENTPRTGTFAYQTGSDHL